MSDQNPPQPPTPPAGQPPYQAPVAPPAPPAYGAAPAYDPSGAPAPGAPVPGKTLGIVAFVLSFFAQLFGLILGIVAFVQSKKAGVKNTWALAAIIISSVLMVLSIVLAVVIFTSVLGAADAACDELGPGIWQLTDGSTITCD